MPRQKLPLVDPCPIAPVVDVVFGRWTSHVLWTLAHDGRLRFTELQHHVPGISPKVLTERLRQLERDGLVSRSHYSEIPPRVEYEMTALGQTLVPVFRTLSDWSDQHLVDVRAAQQEYDLERWGPSAGAPLHRWGEER
jgi:DNA-binding HxlR family transcriptional regulator